MGRGGLALVMLVGVAGCDLRDRYVAASPSIWVTTSPARGYEAVGTVGPAPTEAWVRAVNSFGASVASEDASVTLDGVATPVTFDNVGYASLQFDTPGRVAIGGVDVPQEVVTHAGSFVPEGLLRVAAAPIDVENLAGRVTDGSVGVSGSEVWWSDDSGHRAHRVLDAGAAIQGLKVVQADVDDLLDVVVWTSDTVFLLRARTGGGMAWGGGVQCPGYSVGGVGVGDLSGDNIPDLAVAWSRAGSGLVETWHGDGVFGFMKTEPRELVSEPVSLLVADSTGEGQPQITLLFSDGTWERYIEGAPGRLMPIGPAAPVSLSPRPGWILEEALDMDGDGLDEIPSSTPYNPLTANRSMLIFNLGNDALSALPIEDEPSPWYGVGDGDDNLIDDVWFHRSSGGVQAVFYEATPFGPSYPRRTVLDATPGPGPIDIDDIDGDGQNDIWIAAPNVWWGIRGRPIPFDPDRFWEPEEPSDTFVREDLVGTFRFIELDGNPSTIDFVAGHREGSQLDLSVLQFEAEDERAERLGRADLAGSELLDLEVCGNTAYALTDTALHAVSLPSTGFPIVTAQINVSDPRDVECGSGPGGAAATLAAGGELISFSATLSEVNRSASDAYGVAYGNLDGSGVQVHACLTEGCTMEAWTLASGETGLLILDPSSARWVNAAGTATEIPGFGDTLRLRDLDGDGVLEALGHDGATGVVSIFRQVAGAVAPAHLWQSATPWIGGIDVHDTDMDGDLDIWGFDDEGTLRYSHEDRDVTDSATGGTGSTGDTGSGTTGGTTPGATGHTGDTAGTGTGSGT